MRQGITITPFASSSSQRAPVPAPTSIRLHGPTLRLFAPARGASLVARAAVDGQQTSAHNKPDLVRQSRPAAATPAPLGLRPRSPSPAAGQQPDSPAGEPSARRRTAWNKGKATPEDVRLKMSDAAKKRWADPQRHAAASAALKGKPAWNKGRTLSEETREKMRAAKLNRPLSRATRQKMSAARMGKPIPPETAAAVSAALSGRPKSPAHKAAIAATQRRRHAAVRVLAAVEAAYPQSSDEGNGMGVGSGRAGAALKKERSQALNAFKAELREYRALQEELSPWTQAFFERHGRKPTTTDVQNTGIQWLIARYKQYILLRERIFTETSVLRGRLEGAAARGEAEAGPAMPAGAAAGPINANGPTAGARSALASRVAAAMQYKAKRDAAAAASDSEAAPTEAAAVAAEASAEARAPPSPALLAAQVQAQSQAPPRVRAAMQAAMDYRRKKAEATAAKAMAAAVSAKSGWSEGRLTGAKATQEAAEGAAAAAAAGGNGAAGPACVLPADIVRAQAVAHRAMKEVKQAEAEVRRALRLDGSISDADDAPAAAAAGAGA